MQIHNFQNAQDLKQILQTAYDAGNRIKLVNNNSVAIYDKPVSALGRAIQWLQKVTGYTRRQHERVVKVFHELVAKESGKPVKQTGLNSDLRQRSASLGDSQTPQSALKEMKRPPSSDSSDIKPPPKPPRLNKQAESNVKQQSQITQATQPQTHTLKSVDLENIAIVRSFADLPASMQELLADIAWKNPRISAQEARADFIETMNIYLDNLSSSLDEGGLSQEDIASLEEDIAHCQAILKQEFDDAIFVPHPGIQYVSNLFDQAYKTNKDVDSEEFKYYLLDHIEEKVEDIAIAKASALDNEVLGYLVGYTAALRDGVRPTEGPYLPGLMDLHIPNQSELASTSELPSNEVSTLSAESNPQSENVSLASVNLENVKTNNQIVIPQSFRYALADIAWEFPRASREQLRSEFLETVQNYLDELQVEAQSGKTDGTLNDEEIASLENEIKEGKALLSNQLPDEFFSATKGIQIASELFHKAIQIHPDIESDAFKDYFCDRLNESAAELDTQGKDLISDTQTHLCISGYVLAVLNGGDPDQQIYLPGLKDLHIPSFFKA
jgi:hypothetical protein